MWIVPEWVNNPKDAVKHMKWVDADAAAIISALEAENKWYRAAYQQAIAELRALRDEEDEV